MENKIIVSLNNRPSPRNTYPTNVWQADIVNFHNKSTLIDENQMQVLFLF